MMYYQYMFLYNILSMKFLWVRLSLTMQRMGVNRDAFEKFIVSSLAQIVKTREVVWTEARFDAPHDECLNSTSYKIRWDETRRDETRRDETRRDETRRDTIR